MDDREIERHESRKSPVLSMLRTPPKATLVTWQKQATHIRKREKDDVGSFTAALRVHSD